MRVELLRFIKMKMGPQRMNILFVKCLFKTRVLKTGITVSFDWGLGHAL